MSWDAFKPGQYVFKRKLFEVLGQRYTVTDTQGNAVLQAKLKAFKLREDIRLYFDESLTNEALIIRARQMVDFAATYDVIDPKTQQRLGAFRRKGIRSMLRDQWEILDFDDRVIGAIDEDSLGMAIVRRFVFQWLSQRYHAAVGGRAVWHFHRHLSLFLMKMTVNLISNSGVDLRLGFAAAILLCALEGKQR